ncbi:MAG: hypothetical protein MUE41_02950 [Gemmatimonadaceae bacterium]|jgi:hypothetical protein|nr:hypothetical protein [Gemmatimonadaceae bacterium]
MRLARTLLLAGACLAARAVPAQPVAEQTEADSYTRYELLAPGSAKFRILYDVTATTPGATAYFNVIRAGSVATDERVIDRATGEPLRFEVVSGAVARAGGVRGADSSGQYIRVRLRRAVPPDGGEQRVTIDKTYEDARSYFVEDGELVFRRDLGIKRNAVVLPVGYALVSCNYPVQVLQERDGRLKVSFVNVTPSSAPLELRARAVPAPPRASSVAARLVERAAQTREIVYFLRDPTTHAFDLYHDYTETRAGVGTYLNVVREGSTVSRPSARNLDTGDTLAWRIVTGADEIRRQGLDVPNATSATEVVVFSFPPPRAGGSVRLRMFETYTDPARYSLIDDELVWDRALGRPANAIVLPPGWTLTNSLVPGTIRTLGDGRVRLDFLNPRADDVQTVITARRTAPTR